MNSGIPVNVKVDIDSEDINALAFIIFGSVVLLAILMRLKI